MARKPVLWATLLVVVLIAVYIGRTGSSNKVMTFFQGIMTQPTPTRRSAYIMLDGATPDPNMVILTPVPGAPTPYFLFEEEDAVRRAKELTNTDQWIRYVARRTTSDQIHSMINARPAPDIETDNSYARWIVGFENSQELTAAQIAGAVDIYPLTGNEAAKPLGTAKALVVMDEVGNIYTAMDMERKMPGGGMFVQISFEMIEDLPEIPASIPKPSLSPSQ
jgi:hypothetical protein